MCLEDGKRLKMLKRRIRASYPIYSRGAAKRSSSVYLTFVLPVEAAMSAKLKKLTTTACCRRRSPSLQPVPVGNLIWLAVDRESDDAVVQ